ncbi:hypothetical protein CVT24_011552 [Panaeolus cyanescens]|uniref:DUF6535 domain-containing protein n=1 Tax=Panaeolus cyanescens TaxID=181874 RepID=A0A409VLX1_9AGAR|nr:hypothetical protein CVT24_011552 [Panaeolus cyanescens]
MCASWKDEVENLLIVAGLFSAVSTAFAVETGNLLQAEPDMTSTSILLHISSQLSAAFPNASISGNNPYPQQAAVFQPFAVTPQAFRINALIYISMVLNLMAASIGILCLQWIREFQGSVATTPDDSLAKRQLKYEVLIQVALVLFLIGLVDFLLARYPPMAYTVGTIVLLILLFLLITTISPSICHLYASIHCNTNPCPYKSPQSWAFQRALYFLLLPVGIWVLEPLPLRGRSIIKHGLVGRFKSLIRVKTWLSVDNALQEFRKDQKVPRPLSFRVPPTAASLAWIARTFRDSLESVEAVYECVSQQSLSEIWYINDKVINPQSDGVEDVAIEAAKQHSLTGLKGSWAKELALLAFLREFDKNIFMRQSCRLSQHRMELYIRAINDESIAVQSRRWHRKGIPEIYWDNIPSLEMNHDVQRQLLYRLLRLQQRGDNLSFSQWNLLWSIVWRQLLPGALELTDPETFWNDLFGTMEKWMIRRLESTTETRRLLHWGHAFYLQVAFQFAHGRFEGSIENTTWDIGSTLVKHPILVRCLNHWTSDPDYPLYIVPSATFNPLLWNHFVDMFNMDGSLLSDLVPF